MMTASNMPCDFGQLNENLLQEKDQGFRDAGWAWAGVQDAGYPISFMKLSRKSYHAKDFFVCEIRQK